VHLPATDWSGSERRAQANVTYNALLAVLTNNMVFKYMHI
jgi:hypothetical protein